MGYTRPATVVLFLVLLSATVTAAVGKGTDEAIGSLAWSDYEKKMLRDEIDSILTQTGSDVPDAEIAAVIRSNPADDILDVLSGVYRLVALWETAKGGPSNSVFSPSIGLAQLGFGASQPPAEWVDAVQRIEQLTSNMGNTLPPALDTPTWSRDAQKWIMQSIESFGQWSAEQQRRSQAMLDTKRAEFTSYYHTFSYNSPNWRRMESDFDRKTQELLVKMNQLRAMFEQEWNRAYARVSSEMAK